MRQRKYAFFLNPTSRDGRTGDRLESLLDDADDLRARADVIPTTDPDEAERALAKLDDDVTPVACGGDGTVNLIARTLRKLGQGDRPFGIIPLGTGNAVAHAIGISDLDTAVDVLRAPKEKKYDIFATTHPEIPIALVSLSTGIESVFLTEMAEHESWQRFLGAMRAVAAVTRNFKEITVTLDGTEYVSPAESVYNVGVYNHHAYAFGHEVLPGNDASDGRGMAVRCNSAASYIRTIVNGTREGDTGDVITRSWQTATIDSPHPVQYDGEAADPGKFDLEVEKEAITLLVGGGVAPRQI